MTIRNSSIWKFSTKKGKIKTSKKIPKTKKKSVTFFPKSVHLITKNPNNSDAKSFFFLSSFFAHNEIFMIWFSSLFLTLSAILASYKWAESMNLWLLINQTIISIHELENAFEQSFSGNSVEINVKIQQKCVFFFILHDKSKPIFLAIYSRPSRRIYL